MLRRFCSSVSFLLTGCPGLVVEALNSWSSTWFGAVFFRELLPGGVSMAEAILLGVRFEGVLVGCFARFLGGGCSGSDGSNLEVEASR